MLPAAFETAERMRVHDLRVLLLRGEREIHRGMSAQEREEERTLAGEIVSLHAQLSRERSLPKPDAARIARIEKAVAEATGKKTAQQQALFAKLPALATWRGLMAPATRADVEKLLPDAAVLVVQLVVTEDSLLVLFARRGDDGSSILESVRAGVTADDCRARDQAPATRAPARSGGMAKSDARTDSRPCRVVRDRDPRDCRSARGPLARAIRGARRPKTACSLTRPPSLTRPR